MTTPFHSLGDYLALPRASALHLSPDGTAAVLAVATLDEKKVTWVTNLWLVDPAGEAAPRRLTRGAKGESMAAFTDRGDLLFVAKRPGDESDEDAPAPLWLLPREGGEPRVVATHPGGFSSIQVRGSTVLLGASVLPGSEDITADEKRRKERKDNKVTAILHSGYPVRFWDQDLGPGQPRLYIADLAALETALAGVEDPRLTLRDITPDAGRHLGAEPAAQLAWDGSFVAAQWTVFEARGEQRTQIVSIDTATGERTVLLDEEGVEFYAPTISPCGERLAFVSDPKSTPVRAPHPRLEVLDLASGERHRLLGGWDNWPGTCEWLPDGSALLMHADENGRSPLFLVPADGGEITRLTGEGAYTHARVLPDGSAVLALRASYEYPAEPVRVDLTAARTSAEFTEGEAGVVVLAAPAPRPELPGRLEEVEAIAPDGQRIRAFLALPHGASAATPAPLLLWIHGGPLGSWNSWSWRWCPWLMVAAGYAVLLPDPAMSTGYGQHMIERGWGNWGPPTLADVLASTNAALEREDLDPDRTAAMGGSFGGYMANWTAGHTDRFKAIVTHASLWALDQFGPTTDAAFYWSRELSAEQMEDNSPHRSVENIVTPMLVIHGDKDYRVPIGEGLRLWWDLLANSGLPAGADGESPHRFLYFPDENHWVLTPQNSKVWNEVVLGFLGEHVLGAGAPEPPAVLG